MKKLLFPLLAALCVGFFAIGCEDTKWVDGTEIGLKLSRQSLTMTPAQRATLQATLDPAPADETIDVQWHSSDTAIATVDQNGAVTAVAVGTANITAAVNGASAICVVSVVYPDATAETLTLEKSTLDLPMGASETLKATITPEGAPSAVAWSTSDGSVASVDQNGTVTGLLPGKTATITAISVSNSSLVKTCTVTVKEGTVGGTIGSQTWSLTIAGGVGTLSITGAGEMQNFTFRDTQNNSAPWYAWREAIQTIDIGAGITSIGNYAFDGAKNLTSVNLQTTALGSIGDYAFRNCSSLTALPLRQTVTKLGRNVFQYCSAASGTLDLPQQLTSLPPYAFDGCSSLTGTVAIPATIGTSPGEYVFQNCKGLTGATLAEGITGTGAYTFFGCSGLTSVSLPKSLARLGLGAFAYCSALTEISLTNPNGVDGLNVGSWSNGIGNGTFCDCFALETINIYCTRVMGLGNYKNGNDYLFPAPNAKLHVLQGLKAAYDDPENGWWLVLFNRRMTEPSKTEDGTIIPPKTINDNNIIDDLTAL